MTLAIINTRARLGLEAPPVTVEVHLSNGLPSLSIVGMAETAVKESKDRVRSAILNSHFEFPARRITVNLAPADLPKAGGQFDLPIALGILAASGQLPDARFEQLEFMGELALNGNLRAVPGCLPAAIACGRVGHGLCCPADNATEAALSGETEIFAADSLLAVTAHLIGAQALQPHTGEVYAQPAAASLAGQPDLSEIKGQAQAKRALEIAAAGNHHILLYGPPGTGKSMLAARLPGLLPALSKAAAVEVACMHSLTRRQPLNRYPQRPYANPHHTASAVALVGGGSNPQPGEISLAHNGVLFLDELPEFQRSVLEVLREPLESGFIRISRAAAQVEYPARFLLVAAMNPCPCGYLGQPQSRSGKCCSCSPDQVRRYRNKISGPLLDRIDLQVPVLALKQGELFNASSAEGSAAVRERVALARELQQQRQQCNNGQLDNRQLAQCHPLSKSQQQLMEHAMLNLGFSARALHRTHKVARTIADLAGASEIGDQHLLEAFSYRNFDRDQTDPAL
ncbi:YifB family Mg chelatase-like AAA ATPase [Pseudomaricurvus alcaniphilus]|uniref:YifB family Mg chelatase-like AAA ATPase n=1 Tax=Pseudomaricurvus alcaniphilus TaxID=1166482 RepID=UPI00140B1721|nr:YifB family Mg chelatase-like AAA ATPase [Pseudomaricurvus alcaniphilus]NHN38620.1 YifB family Mg chelatase-like AAA ATPase [Pseudomaricurvus alcaniphilus]